MRIGHGFDAHRFTDGAHIVLGGVKIPFDKGLAAHSDGDVLIHAICDALLGAAGLGDIGRHFPDSSSDYAGIDSRILLRRVVEMLAARHHRVMNVDATVIAQKPKLAPHMETMKGYIAQDIGIGTELINLKATTTEGMGYTGREEGIAAHAVALIDSSGNARSA